MPRTPKQKEQATQDYKDRLIRSRLLTQEKQQEEATVLNHKVVGIQGTDELHAVTYKVDDVMYYDTVVGYHRRDFAPGDTVLFRLTGRKEFPVEMVQSGDY